MTHRDEDEEIIDTALDTLAWQRREIDRLKAENERLRYHLEGTLETLLDAEVCSTDCVHCNAARAALGEKP